ncbi:GTPase [Fistulina hepatica ATCC 64428]|uniref:GTPase n=1 Tax=Fistulina hepatica ATCC 64428 TaxID=1128425 RepID=A0A0D7AHG4_9AGAR|nr:GTPase [Fistulina hepatica ATCC 64428]
MSRTLRSLNCASRICRRSFRWSCVAFDDSHDLAAFGAEEWRELEARQRKIQYKRRLGGQTFLDYQIVDVQAGRGGDGCVAFHREKFKPKGPPSGGDGGRGGDVHILPDPALTSLHSVPKRIRAEDGRHGAGTWQNGKNGAPLTIRVPVGTVVRQLPWNHPRRVKDEWEREEEELEGLDATEKRELMRAKRWSHYPDHAEENVQKETFKHAEAMQYHDERRRRLAIRDRALNSPIYLDLDHEEVIEEDVDGPLGTRRRRPLGHLIATGGPGGQGNPHFLSQDNRAPKFASRGQAGERLTLMLELKILADVGLVGFPNAGKSTLLRALTGGRARTEVAGYAFTTLSPVVGTVRVAEDGTFEGSLSPVSVFQDSVSEEVKEQEKMENGEYAYSPTRNEHAEDKDESESLRPGQGFDIAEAFRFTVADNPGLISGSSKNVGLGHSFLRSMERSLALVYVVDLSAPAPWDELAVLRQELEMYQSGLSERACMIIANKADVLAEDGDNDSVKAAQAKLQQLKDYVASDFPQGKELVVLPVSAKYSQNLAKAVSLMRTYVEKARTMHSGVGK